ncbi:hypothetical protein NUITMVRE34_30420 [Enterococcus gallinarum]|nr:hypothetical protein NUITMVRE34_30420 [Enterococcus gallinarum]GMS52906.1 hypothetical protein NUITMVRE35_30420 [Enterococcus gallinarum]
MGDFIYKRLHIYVLTTTISVHRTDLQEPLIETSKRINRIVAAEDALFPGEIRTGGVEVSTIQGRYVPPMLTEDEVNNQYGEIMNKEISDTEKALRLFLFI